MPGGHEHRPDRVSEVSSGPHEVNRRRPERVGAVYRRPGRQNDGRPRCPTTASRARAVRLVDRVVRGADPC